MTTKEKGVCQDALNQNTLTANVTTKLPESFEERIQLVLKSDLSPQKRRLLEYLIRKPDAWTHELAANCAVGFPPNRLGELNREILPHHGLYALCHKPDKWLRNRHGDVSYVHQWRLVLLPDQKEVAA